MDETEDFEKRGEVKADDSEDECAANQNQTCETEKSTVDNMYSEKTLVDTLEILREKINEPADEL